MPNQNVKPDGTEFEPKEIFGSLTGDLYTHQRGGRNVSSSHKLTIEVDVKLTPEQVSDAFYHMSSQDQAEFFRRLYERWTCVGRFMTQDLQRIGEYLAEDKRRWGYLMIAALHQFAGDSNVTTDDR